MKTYLGYNTLQWPTISSEPEENADLQVNSRCNDHYHKSVILHRLQKCTTLRCQWDLAEMSQTGSAHLLKSNVPGQKTQIQ